MSTTVITGEKDDVIRTLGGQIAEGEALEPSVSIADLDAWKNTTAKMIERSFSDQAVTRSFWMASSTIGSSTFRGGQEDEAAQSLKNAIRFLSGLVSDIEKGLHDPINENGIDQATALTIIRRILQNFHKHLESMYQDNVHGNGTIKKEDLDRIQIGNEYDVQRILYALIRPVFPEARMEVPGDAGYKSFRYDIFLDEYDLVIEIKCSRKRMTERDLTEELGADAFHYQSKHLFLFLYDKEKIVTNVDAFQKAYKRDKSTFGKDVEAIVIQPITL